MRAPGFIITPFALNGDKATIPIPVQPSGGVSFTQGWGPDYAKNLVTEPATAKPVDRAVENQLMYAITQLLNRWQLEGAPEYVPPADNGGNPVSYPAGAQILAFDSTGKRKIWVNTAANNAENNQAPPSDPLLNTGNGWTMIASFLSGNLVLNTATLQTVVGPVTFNGITRVVAPAISLTPGTQVVDSNYVTRGRSLSFPSNITYGDKGTFILPTAFGQPSVGRYCRQYGIDISPTPSSTEQDLSWTIYFQTPFAQPPVVQITAHSTNQYSDLAIARISSLSTNSFTCRVTNTNAQRLVYPIGVNWSADGIVAAAL